MKTSEIQVTLSCGHVVNYDKLSEPCPICFKVQEQVPIDGAVMDEVHKVILEITDLISHNKLNMSGKLEFVGGVLKLVIDDLKKKKTYRLKSDKIHKLHKELFSKLDEWVVFGKRGKSVFKAIFSRQYYDGYFDFMDEPLPKWECFLKKRIVLRIQKLLTFATAGTLLILL